MRETGNWDNAYKAVIFPLRSHFDEELNKDRAAASSQKSGRQARRFGHDAENLGSNNSAKSYRPSGSLERQTAGAARRGGLRRSDDDPPDLRLKSRLPPLSSSPLYILGARHNKKLQTGDRENGRMARGADQVSARELSCDD
ncbi:MULTISPECIES: hypothetical protein [Bradyrhizobium]|uniref:Uncharacterized protein n=1 Tax=Bradyrhizobium vignae TaxID=1549949 RepID=A0A2U3PWF4_9BRAD|nr:hypothetical protein [Bradyrhizobium vignae]RXG85385.1 hypothetical protein EAV90_35505 [Bradyrhizobium vignae]SPP93490.1 protein of unknown function [Bradyrhizobium vignae]